MTLFKDEYEWVAVAHYNISLIMMQRKNYDECIKLIKDLNVSSLSIQVERGHDTLFHLPYKIDNISINLEIATIHECMGHKTLARNLFFESWEIVSKYRMPGQTMAFDYQCGSATFLEWYSSESTFHQLGDMYRILSNLIMAAEMYRMAAERALKLFTLNDMFDLSHEDWRNFPKEKQDCFLMVLLNRAECLSEIAEFTEAEKYAGFIFSKRRTDVHLCGRAAKCCRRNKNTPPLIRELQEGADRMERGILLVQSRYRMRLAQVERENLKYGIKAGFTVTSFLRMLLVRNRMVERRCSNCPPQHMNALVKSFLEGRISIMKSGSESLLAHIELWYLAATTVQNCVKKWYARKNFNKFFKGIRGLERIFRGQICRKRIRKYFSKIQSKLDNNPSDEERAQMTKVERMKIDYERIERLCCGTTCISSEESIQGTIQLSAEESPLRHKTRRDRRRRINPVTGRFEDNLAGSTTTNPMLSQNSANFLHSHSRTQHSRSLGHSHSHTFSHEEQKTDDSQAENSILKSKTLNGDTDLPQINSFQFASPTSSRKNSSRKKSVLSSRRDSGNNYTGGNTARSEMSTDSSIGSARFTGKKFSADLIKEFAARNPDEDVISFVSYMSVKDDSTKQWIPFGILPEREIIRLVQCTVLILSSPSFSMQDCKRMTTIIKKYSLDSWKRLKSLFVGGTRMGISGLRDLLELGIDHMQSLTFSNTGMNHFFGQDLGAQLISKELVQRIKSNSKLPQTIDVKTTVKLKKLYIENEKFFGDRGFNALVKNLQVNISLEILVVRNCNVSNRGAQSCARYIGVSNTIQIINITENLIDREGYLNVMHAVGSRGFRGSLQKVYMAHQSPGYKNHDELVELFTRGTELGITMESDEMTARELTHIEMMRVRDTDKEDIQHMHNVFKQILEDDRVEKEQILTNSFKKIIYL